MDEATVAPMSCMGRAPHLSLIPFLLGVLLSSQTVRNAQTSGVLGVIKNV